MFFSYWDSFENFKEGLPSKDEFYSTLTNRAVSDKNFEHVLNVWKSFKIKTMKNYHGLYLNVDVLLLARLFEAFLKKCKNSF